MRRFIPAVAFLALALAAARADDKDDPKAAAKKLEGSYTVVEVLIDGKPDAKKDDVSGFTIKDGTIAVKTKNREEKATFKLDPSKKPAHIDLTPENEKEVILGIYEAKDTDKGLELTIAFSGDDPKAERPKDFKGGKGVFVIKLLRKKE